ncbi:protein RRP6-like 3 isoform X1 [Ricinus communis]|uniref:protein RRP6-like 3 isoform X1 n=1 Tax=Ricinus communis TaxID=3988 RepID=UPI0007728010|nr:protein RRP6-like 3 isoform X1 [Ricinus communis]|eukprot:XP_015577871.1 protein RRP6-like 3 isoform X1 [Ricinus communis]
MEYKEKIRIAIAIVSLAAISFVFTRQYRNRRRQRQKCSSSSCYLHSDQKPQCSFKRVLADNSFSQFKHLKLHGNKNGFDAMSGNSSSSHPYEREISALIENSGIEFGFEINSIVDLKEMKDDYVWVETESQLKELTDELSNQSVFAVDTEQHSLRSFLGFTALVQISTQKEDYLLDTIALHDAMGILGAVFANPKICKVFHGGDNDILWLQRDFHIYVVNLFDTAKACEVLSKPQKSLAYLLETYCGVSTNKLLQREDWRQRPLPAEMLQYALTDAHYLLYIASCLIAELKQKDNDNSYSYPDVKLKFILEASRRSNMICMQLYTKEVEEFPGDAAASSLFSRYLNDQGGSSVSCEIQDLVRRLCTWRELMARVHDEGLRFVLSDQAIVSLANKVSTNAMEIYDTIAQADNMDPMNCISSQPSPSPVVCSHFYDFCCLIQENKSNLDDIFSLLLQKCLGPNGSCPLSVYNYALLISCDVRLTNRSMSKKNGFKSSKQVARKASRSRELFVQKFSCKSPVYHNCRIYANDGRLLCYCDRRKLEWYLHRELAILVDENPPAIRLLFEPKGRPEDEDNDFYIQSKRNICVGCGEGSHYLRYRIIPSCYRIHFPEHLKSHRSHDIVLLCVDCHEVAHAAAEKYKRHVAVEFGIPLFVRKVVDSKESAIISESSSSLMTAEEAGVSPLQLRTAAMALLRHGPRMPPKRREELTQIVTQYYGGREISQEDLERALLVGMSPHERRRFEKKRGLSLKRSANNICSNNELVHDVTMVKSSVENNSITDTPDSSQTINSELRTEVKEDQDFFKTTDPDVGVSSNLQVADVSAAAHKDMNSNENEVSDGKEICAGNDGDTCEINPPNGIVCSNYPTHGGHGLSKNNSKLSLLGHGPHGKQVVEHLLKEYGDDGIREFCQRWRQVFVEAVHPRFLPAGWDVMHSGRREFGEFSVYNPTKRASAATS